MEFNNEDLYMLLQNIAKQSELLQLFYKGWTDFNNDRLKFNACHSNSNCFNEQGESMKNIIKRKDNRFMIRKNISGKRVTRYAKSITEAKSILRELNKEWRKTVPVLEKQKDYTFEEYSTFWLETFRKPFITKKSCYEVSKFLNRISSVFGSYKLTQINSNAIQHYLNNLPSGRSKEKLHTYFNAVMQKAVDTGLILNNPFVAVVKDKKIKSKNSAYTFAEQQKILSAIKGTDIEHEVMTYLMCGCRPNELPNKENFDFENNLINIYGTKNDNALHRQIEITQLYADYMKRYFDKQDMQAERYVSRKFTKLCEDAGIIKPLLYKLRHTFATNHFTLGTQPKIVQNWLGHASISMTLDTYTDIDKTATKNKIIELYNNFYYIKSEN